MTGDVKIQLGMSPVDPERPEAFYPDPHDVVVLLNGHKLEGLCELQVNINPMSMPTVTFTIEPATMDIEGLAELRRVFSTDCLFWSDDKPVGTEPCNNCNACLDMINQLREGISPEGLAEMDAEAIKAEYDATHGPEGK